MKNVFLKINDFAFLFLPFLFYFIALVLKGEVYYEIMAMLYKLSNNVNLTQKEEYDLNLKDKTLFSLKVINRYSGQGVWEIIDHILLLWSMFICGFQFDKKYIYRTWICGNKEKIFLTSFHKITGSRNIFHWNATFLLSKKLAMFKESFI